jgi:hypothetical protein
MCVQTYMLDKEHAGGNVGKQSDVLEKLPLHLIALFLSKNAATKKAAKRRDGSIELTTHRMHHDRDVY